MAKNSRIYRPYHYQQYAQKHLTDVGGCVTFRQSQAMFEFPNQQAYDQFLKLNRERWLRDHEQTNV